MFNNLYTKFTCYGVGMVRGGGVGMVMVIATVSKMMATKSVCFVWQERGVL